MEPKVSDESRNSSEASKKGFAGLSSLATNVDSFLTKVDLTETEGSERKTRTPNPDPTQPATTNDGSSKGSRTAPVYQDSPKVTGPNSGLKWFFGIVGLIVVIGWFNSNQSSHSPTSNKTTTAQGSSTTYTPPLDNSKPTESIPPKGKSLVLNTSQIIYCLAEDIRIEGSSPRVDNYSQAQVDRFNQFIDEYNSRCGNFRYRGDDLEIAKEIVKANRNSLLADGRKRF